MCQSYKVPFLDLKRINDSFEPQISQAIKRVLASGWYLLGEEVHSFENEYRNFIGTEFCIGVASGLDALRLILRSYIEMGLFSKGDEVIVPANTFIASILAITENKLVPVFAEPDETTFNVNIERIEAKITARTKAIMIVHLYGRVCWSAKLDEIAKRYNLKIIEDNAQAVGSIITDGSNRRTGSLGDAAGHSFYPGKNLGAIGDGGAITTNDINLAEIARSVANYGLEKKYYNKYKGLNSRLDEIQAAVLRVKLRRLDHDNQFRREIARYYLDHISNPKISLPQPCKEDHVWHLFVIKTLYRDRVRNLLAEKGIETMIHYPVPPHKQDAYTEYHHLSLPTTEGLHNQVLSLPIHQRMLHQEIEDVTTCINSLVL